MQQSHCIAALPSFHPLTQPTAKETDHICTKQNNCYYAYMYNVCIGDGGSGELVSGGVDVVVVGVNASRTEVVGGSTLVIVDGDDRVVEWCSEDW